jgi:hypothetical protein
MLSHQQILHFRTFGYVTLRGLLSPAEAATLRQEVTGALADAFGKIATEPNDLGGISGDYLPLAVSRAPFSLALIADDPRTFGSSAELLGSPTVPSAGIATCFTGDPTWHTRRGPGIGGVTFWADLEPRTAGTGALRLIPGSHLREFERQLCQYRAAEAAMSGFGDEPGSAARRVSPCCCPSSATSAPPRSGPRQGPVTRPGPWWQNLPPTWPGECGLRPVGPAMLRYGSGPMSSRWSAHSGQLANYPKNRQAAAN